MNNPKSCESECISDDKNDALEDLEWNECDSLERKHVNVLLDISEEHTLKEQDPYMAQSQGWEEAIKGWGRSAPLACLFQAQRKGRKVKSDVIDFHCLLCADLKLSELLVSGCAGTSSEFCVITEESLKNTIPASLELLKRAPSNSSLSPSEEESSDFSKGEQCIHNKTLPHHFQPNAQCTFLKDRGAGKVALIGSLLVLPPVIPPTPANSKSPILLKRREARDTCPAEGEVNSVAVCGTTGSVTVGEKVVTDGEGEKAVVIPYCSSTVDTCQGSLTSKHEPSQHQYHLLSIAVSKKAYLLPQATSLLGRNLRRDELTRSPLRHNSGHRPNLCLKAKSIKKAEPELPMLLGTRVAIPVSAQRLL
ncbi:uncharacterized protein C16orf46 homolog [Pygocentrus nattereri]|uniref:uncharacterized protein C16orf46 homolog n=1 Tax=Pygocentrus nattereri TaxID=42514 RepID=UPI000814639E|nr:uncharacterized protein C16orf46 homolog [Pygocentrus nattereri]XP_017578197.1 uncharacterized protein C16orf46 homolog [Pygocentrus nattereri]XP_017578198.1 uncharacterized protein C16orf46 homolog [Pygocentrus nattereri]